MNFFTDIGGMILDGILDYKAEPILAFLSVIMVLCVGALAIMLGYFVFYLIDSSFRKKFTTSGILIQKGFTPAHTTMVMQQVGKVMVPTTIHHPDRWTFLVELGGAIDVEQAGVDVSEETYNELNVGHHLSVRAVTGRLSGSTYITSVIRD